MASNLEAMASNLISSAQERLRSERGRSHPAGSRWIRRDDPRDAR